MPFFSPYSGLRLVCMAMMPPAMLCHLTSSKPVSTSMDANSLWLGKALMDFARYTKPLVYYEQNIANGQNEPVPIFFGTVLSSIPSQGSAACLSTLVIRSLLSARGELVAGYSVAAAGSPSHAVATWLAPASVARTIINLDPRPICRTGAHNVLLISSFEPGVRPTLRLGCSVFLCGAVRREWYDLGSFLMFCHWSRRGVDLVRLPLRRCTAAQTFARCFAKAPMSRVGVAASASWYGSAWF